MLLKSFQLLLMVLLRIGHSSKNRAKVGLFPETRKIVEGKKKKKKKIIIIIKIIK